jgi:hypothetical protein
LQLHGDITTESEGDDSGDIVIHASESLAIVGNTLRANTGHGSAGDIKIQGAGIVTLGGVDEHGWSIRTRGTGGAGKVAIVVDSVSLAGGIDASGDGGSGGIEIKGQEIELNGSLTTAANGGDAGPITVSAAQLLRISGGTISESDEALWELLETWNSTDSYDLRAIAVESLIQAFDDHELDQMTGIAGRDLWFAGLGDALVDVQLRGQWEGIVRTN